jgi:hypothetical protein
MNDDPAMAFSHRLAEARDSLAGEHMTIPASEIFARYKRRRARRWLAAGGAACLAAGVAVAVGLAPGSSSAPPQHAQLAAWTVHTNRDGTVTFTLRETSHPAQLQQALTEAGVPAVVRFGEICQAEGKGQVLLSTQGFVYGTGPGLAPGASSWMELLGGPGPIGDWSWVITPGKIPPGGHFVISAVPRPVPANEVQIAWEFAKTSAPLVCATHWKA